MMDTLMKKCSWRNVDTGLLILRIGIGLIFIFSGITKLIDMNMTVTMFSQIGIAAIFTYMVAIAEFAGGIMLALGIASRIWTIILGIIMLVAVILTYKDPAMVMTPFVLLFSLISLVLSGSGKYALTKNC